MQKYQCFITFQLHNGRKETHRVVVKAENYMEAKTRAFEYFMCVAKAGPAGSKEKPIFIGSEVEQLPDCSGNK